MMVAYPALASLARPRNSIGFVWLFEALWVVMSHRGRPAASTEEQRERVLELAAQGFSQRQIAEEVFGDVRLRARVERILRRPPEQTPSAGPSDGLPRGEREGDLEAPLDSGSDLRTLAGLVARFERSLTSSDGVPSLSEIERLIRVKRQLAGMATLERLNAVTREHASS
jgi:hypothetical protein